MGENLSSDWTKKVRRAGFRYLVFEDVAVAEVSPLPLARAGSETALFSFSFFLCFSDDR